MNYLYVAQFLFEFVPDTVFTVIFSLSRPRYFKKNFINHWYFILQVVFLNFMKNAQVFVKVVRIMVTLCYHWPVWLYATQVNNKHKAELSRPMLQQLQTLKRELKANWLKFYPSCFLEEKRTPLTWICWRNTKSLMFWMSLMIVQIPSHISKTLPTKTCQWKTTVKQISPTFSPKHSRL